MFTHTPLLHTWSRKSWHSSTSAGRMVRDVPPTKRAGEWARVWGAGWGRVWLRGIPREERQRDGNRDLEVDTEKDGAQVTVHGR